MFQVHYTMMSLSGLSDNNSDINPVVCVSSDSIIDESSELCNLAHTWMNKLWIQHILYKE